MAKLSAVSCESAKPDKSRDRLLGDGDGLFLRVRPHGTKTWLIEYIFNGARTKYSVGTYGQGGAPGESITEWLRYGRLSLTQARAIADTPDQRPLGGEYPSHRHNPMGMRVSGDFETSHKTICDGWKMPETRMDKGL